MKWKQWQENKFYGSDWKEFWDKAKKLARYGIPSEDNPYDDEMFKKQCKKGCPIENDIPDFVHELSMGNMGAAMSIINAKSNLLLGIAPGIIRRAVALYDQTVETQVHSLLAERSDEVAATC